MESNKLKALKEEQYKRIRYIDPISLSEVLVGNIFSRNYDVIKTDFRIHPPSAYVDTSKAYYFDALRYGDIIKVTDKEIYYSLKYFESSRYDLGDINFKRTLLELSNTSMLEKSGEYYYGNEDIYVKLSDLRDSLLAGVIET